MIFFVDAFCISLQKSSLQQFQGKIYAGTLLCTANVSTYAVKLS